MRETVGSEEFRVTAIAGSNCMLLAFNLSEELRKQALGFSIQRVDRGTETAPASGALQDIRWLPNMLRFPSDTATGPNGSDRSPIQRFRWGDYTATPSIQGAMASGARVARRLLRP